MPQTLPKPPAPRSAQWLAAFGDYLTTQVRSHPPDEDTFRQYLEEARSVAEVLSEAP